MSRRRDLPQANSPNFSARLRETVQTYLGRQGNPLDRGITLRDLVDAGVVQLREGFTIGPGTDTLPIRPGAPAPAPAPPDGGGGAVYEPDLTPPPSPSGFAVTAAITHVFIEHDPALYGQGHGHLRTRVFGAIVTPALPNPVFADAIELLQFPGTVGTFPSNPGVTWRLWITWESRDGVQSVAPAGGTNGLEAITGLDVSSLVEAMTGPGNPFVILTEPTTIDGVVFPAGVYSTQAFIRDLQVTRAKIAALAVDDGKIANLSAGKLTAGSIAVGQYIQSANYVPSSNGWIIRGNGMAEFSGVVVRGTIYANAGQIGGSTIGATYIRSLTYSLGVTGWNFNSDGTGQVGGMALLGDALQTHNFVAGTSGWRLRADGSFEGNNGSFRGTIRGSELLLGSFTAYAWPPAGQGGAYLGPSGLLLGNATDNRYFQVTTTGNVYAPGFSIVNGLLTISQANVIDSLQLANNSVSVSSSARGTNYASTNVYVPAGVTATVFAIAVKGVSLNTYMGSGLSNANVTLSLGGSVFTELSRVTIGGYVGDDSGQALNVHAPATVTGEISVVGPATINATASFSSPLSNPTSVILFARWK